MTLPAGSAGPVPGPRVAPARLTGRQSVAARRAGYVAAVLVDAVLLWMLHVWPGWEDVPFLRPDFAAVLGLIDLSLWAGVGLGLIYLVSDPPWLTALGGVATAVIGLLVCVRLWHTFPFDLSDPWTVLLRMGLAAGAAGSAIAVVVHVVTFLLALRASAREDAP